jgi:DNA-binding GntR family transcriptional regulator
LREEILDGALAPGLQIRQEAMAEQFGVSRVPIREALRQLEAEGLVTSELHRGAFVSTRSWEEIEEMLDIRLALEVRALTLALPNLTPGVISKAKKILAAYDRSDDPQEWRDLNIAFHLTLYAPCNRPRLLKMIEDVVLTNHRFVGAHISATVGRVDPQLEHHQLLAACAEGHPRRALQLLEAHIEHTRAALRKRRKPRIDRHVATGLTSTRSRSTKEKA